MGRRRARRRRSAQRGAEGRRTTAATVRTRSTWGARRQMLGIATLIGALAGLVALFDRLPMRGGPEITMDVHSATLQLVPSDRFDLVGRTPEVLRGNAAAIDLATPLVYVRAMEVRPDGGTAAVVDADRAIPAVVLQSLETTGGCSIDMGSRGDGFVRVGITPVTPDAACRVYGAVWTGRPEVPDTLRYAPWMDGVPPGTEMTFEAEPSRTRPAVLEFHPARPVRLARVPVRRLAFETRETAPYPRSSILEASIRFPRQGGHVESARYRDTLLLGVLDGEIVDLSLGDTIRTRFVGRSSFVRTGSRSLTPSVFDQLRYSPLLITVGAVVTALVALVEIGRRL